MALQPPKRPAPSSRVSRHESSFPREYRSMRARLPRDPASASSKPPEPSRPAAAGSASSMRRAAADSRLRQHQLDTARAFHIAREIGRNRSHLLIAGRKQESRRPAIGFHADDEEAGLRLRKLEMPRAA